MVRFGVLALVASCVSSNSVVCDDGSICPRGTVCDPHGLCVDPSQLTACDGKPELADCMVGTVAGHCQDGVCLTPVCGDGFVELGEQCDDGNTLSKDGCSADCTSTESCGNNVVDLDFGETCDDGNHLEHDGCSSSCATEQPRWIEHTLFPPPRSAAGFAYDSVRDRVLVIGGVPTNASAFSDTWEWDGAEWMQVSTVGPTARGQPSVAFDAARKVIVMYGGASGFGLDSDTWLWSGTTWRLAHPATSPGPRAAAGMAYDSKRQRVVMFGGVTTDDTGMQQYPAETWEWDGSTWSKRDTAHVPGARVFAGMAYDPKRGVVVLTGGQKPATPTYSDTWEYDGVDWTLRSSAAPALTHTTLTYDPVTGRNLLYGGNTTTVSAWDGTSWTTVPLAGGPTARSEAVFVATKGRVLVFGGNRFSGGSSNETWFLTNNTWSQPADLSVRHAAVGGVDPLLAQQFVYGGEIAAAPTTQTGETWARTLAGWTLRANAPPTARAYACGTYDYAHHNFVMFGGEVGASLTNETWVWDGAGWMQKASPAAPSPRIGAACAFDGQHVTLIGGLDSGGSEIADAWSWDGTSWTPVPLPSGFVGRGGAVAGYDPKHHHLAMFGGFAPAASLVPADTWLYDGTTWTQIATEGFRPSGRYLAAMAWNPARQTLILTGGAFPVDRLDAFELDDKQWNFVAATNQPPPRQAHLALSTIDGSGITLISGKDPLSSVLLSDRWELRWDSADGTDRCNGKDGDGDGLAKCDDPDCWWVCAPLCPPNTTCDPSAPKCGDGTCTAPREDCHNCAADCTCGAPVCGDGYCDPGETCPGDCP